MGRSLCEADRFLGLEPSPPPGPALKYSYWLFTVLCPSLSSLPSALAGLAAKAVGRGTWGSEAPPGQVPVTSQSDQQCGKAGGPPWQGGDSVPCCCLREVLTRAGDCSAPTD